MVERIRTLLETRQLTPTQFADAIGVARPIVSHILSGRNKPSLEVVQRILAALPDLSMPWLLSGTGPMLAVAAPPSAPQGQSTPPLQPATASQPANTVAAPPPSPGPRPAVPSAPDANQARSNAAQPKPGHAAPTSAAVAFTRPVPRRFAPAEAIPAALAVPLDETAATARPPAPVLETSPPSRDEAGGAPGPPAGAVESSGAVGSDAMAAAFMAGAEKPIRRIVIFYRDGSFSDYHPE